MSLALHPIGGEWRGDRHSLPIRIYYEDTDFSGVVYHASYLRFLERGRTEYLRSLGIHHSGLHARDPAEALAFVVRRMTIDFLKPARMDDLVAVETLPGEIGGASISLSQRILRDGELLLGAEVKIAVVSEGRARRLPAEIRARLAQHAKPIEPSPEG